MSKIALEKDPSKKETEIQTGTEAVMPGSEHAKPVTSESKEWKPTVRMKKRDDTPRQKLRIKDLSPDKQYVKDVIDNELKYFLLVAIPLIITAITALINRGDLHNRLVDTLVKFFSNS